MSRRLDLPGLISCLLAVALLVLGGLFILASADNIVRLPIGIVLVILGAAVALVIKRGRAAPQPPAEPVVYAGGKTSVKELKCPKCGGSLRYDEVQKVLVCQYCKAVSQVEEDPLW